MTALTWSTRGSSTANNRGRLVMAALDATKDASKLRCESEEGCDPCKRRGRGGRSARHRRSVDALEPTTVAAQPSFAGTSRELADPSLQHRPFRCRSVHRWPTGELHDAAFVSRPWGGIIEADPPGRGRWDQGVGLVAVSGHHDHRARAV